MSQTLTGRVALVTGGSKGIGKAIVQSLAGEGAQVAATARGAQALEAVRESCGPGILTIQADATDQEAVNAAVARVIDTFGELDILVNNVGGATRFGSFSDLTGQDWQKTFDLNVLSMVHFVKASEQYLRRSDNGRIINISSISGVQPGSFNPHYTATKAATINLGKSLATYFVKDRVLVNTVCPGPVHSESWDDNVRRLALERGVPEEEAWRQVEREESLKIPLGRVGEGEDVSGLVAFLASDKAAWITGSCFHVNGGKLSTI